MMKSLKLLILIFFFTKTCTAQSNLDTTYNIGASTQFYGVHVFQNHYQLIGETTDFVYDSISGGVVNQGRSSVSIINLNGDSLNTINFSHKDSLLAIHYPFDSFDNLVSSNLNGNVTYSVGVQVTINSFGFNKQLLKFVVIDSLGNPQKDSSYTLLNDSSWFPRHCFYNIYLNNLVVIGDMKNSIGNFAFPFILFIDTTGSISNLIRIFGQGNLHFRNVVMDSLGNIYISGFKIGSYPNSEPITMKVDTSGNIIWSFPYNLSTFSNSASSIISTSDGNIITVYNEALFGPWYKYHLLKLDISGNNIWDRTFSYTKQLSGDGLTELSNSNLIHVSVFRDTVSNSDPVGALLTLFDSNGSKLWERVFFENGGSKGVYDVKPTLDGGFIFCGENDNGFVDSVSGYHTGQAWVVKTDSLGLLTSINNHTPNYLSKASINAPYPNPTNNAITIETFVPLEAKKAMLHLFDIHGKELLKKELSKGKTTTTISLQEYASGNYLIALSVDDYAAGAKRVVKVE